MNNELNPCTCGEEPQVLVADPYVQTWCPNCMNTTVLHGDHEDMVKDWNQQNPK
jgi:hypothetical protein